MGWLWKLMAVYVVVTALVATVLYLTALPPSPDAGVFSRLVIAHRGDALNFPENSLPAIKGAYKLNADAVEIDVMMTSDGVLVAMHDPGLERTTNGNGLVADYTFAEISKLRINSASGGSETSVPSLEQVVQLVLKLGLKLEIELKTEIENKYLASITIARMFEKHSLYENAYVSSFDPRFLYYIRSENPEIVTALAIRPHPPYNKLVEFLIRRDAMVDYLGVGIIVPSIDIADEVFIKKWLARGKAINIWTPNSSMEKSFLKSFPVSITTDCPGDTC